MSKESISKHARSHRPPGTLGPDDPGGSDPILIRAGVTFGTSDPVDPYIGQEYVNTATNHTCWWDGTRWWRTTVVPDSIDAYASAVISDAPSSFWLLDEASGSFADQMPANITGTPEGTVTYGAVSTGSIGPSSCIALGGSTANRVKFGNVYAMDDTGTGGHAFSWEALVYMGSLPGASSTLMNMGAAGNNSWDLRVNTSGQLQFVADWSGFLLGTSTDSLVTGWNHVGFTRNADPVTSTCKFYINGVLDSGTAFTETARIYDTGADLYLGVCMYNTGSPAFIEPMDANMAICGVAIYDGVEVTSGQFAAHAAAAGF